MKNKIIIKGKLDGYNGCENSSENDCYLVKRTNLEELSGYDLNLPPSFNTIRNPSKSFGLELDLSNSENEFIDDSILRCGILSQTIENISSLLNSVKSSSLVTNALCSDFEKSANLPLESPFGFKIISTPCFSRNLFNLSSTFSSKRNLSLDGDIDNDILFTSSQIRCILQSCSNVIPSQGRECLKNFFKWGSSFEHLQYLPDHYSCAFESGLSMANFAVRYNILVDFDSHGAYDGKLVYKFFASENRGWDEK